MSSIRAMSAAASGVAAEATAIDEELGATLAERIRGYCFDEIQQLLEPKERA